MDSVSLRYRKDGWICEMLRLNGWISVSLRKFLW